MVKASKVEFSWKKAAISAIAIGAFVGFIAAAVVGVYYIIKGPQIIRAEAPKNIMQVPKVGKRSVLTIQRNDKVDPASIYESSAVMGNGVFKVTRPAYPLTLEGVCENGESCSLTINSRAEFPKDDVPCKCDKTLFLISFVDPIEPAAPEVDPTKGAKR